MKRIILSLFCVTALALSATAADNAKTSPTPGRNAKASPTPAGDASATPADNTGRNERDRSGETKTSGDQSESPADIKITAAIRRAVVAEGSLSMTAKNVKIITANGVVTLRGPVNTAAEKTKIAQLAKANAGKSKIENQLEVKGAKK